MQRRLHVAIALLHDPSLVILDEPSAGLDVEARREQWAVVRRLQVAGKAVLLSTHLLEEAEELCSRVAVLRAGKIIAQGTPDELRARVGAVELAQVQSPEPDRVVEAAVRAGLTVRRTEQALVIWLPRAMNLREVLAIFDGLPVTAVSRRPVTLEDAYVEVLREADDSGP